ncbi:hypothetical protein [Carboxylicivirga sp. N1Y90]|uniref:hypothetical protein n=1 Tax=Carboxylicivirga fragile TaxID=3417571 RepID=UPI003D348575|nr:hypothetical protein [Marinilabiliaceae bacterium N1Y90]
MKEKHSNLQDAIYRNLQENATYAYEILVEDNSGHILIVPRTNNIEAFNENMKSAKDIVKQDGGNIKVDIYRGKSPKAGLVTRYNIDLDDNSKTEKPVTNQSQIEQAVDMAIKKYQFSRNIGGLGSIENLNMLFGALTGNDADNENNGNTLNGLAGLLGAVNNSRYENTLMQFEKKLSDYKQETELSTLKKQLHKITTERDSLKNQNQELEKANSAYKTEVSELETRLAGYSNTELLKRVATGVLSGIGSKILGNSPKAAELMGLSKDELQAALGFVEEDEELQGHSSITQHDVDVEEMPVPKTEQQKQIFNAINDTAKALKQSDIQFAIYMITIIGNCMESKELTKSMVQHLEKEKQRLTIEEDDESTGKEE